MEEYDFDPRVIELATHYAYAISGGLRIEISDQEIEWIKAQLLFFLVACVTNISPVKKET